MPGNDGGAARPNRIEIDLIGAIAVRHDGVAQPVPASRKTRALLGYLALNPRPMTRQHLCEMFFAGPDDPRAALRWSLTKLRPLVDAAGAQRLVTARDTVRLDVAGLTVDALELVGLAQVDPEDIDAGALARAVARPPGALLEDAELPELPDVSAWLAGARDRLAAARLRLLVLAAQQAGDAPAAVVQAWRPVVDADPSHVEGARRLADALEALGRPEEAAPLRARAGGVPSRSFAAPARAAPARPRLPVVAVLPLADFSEPPLPAWLAEGLADGIVHTLSRFRSLTVLARMSTLRFAGEDLDPQRMGAALGADLIVGGALVAQGPVVRIRWRAAETVTGRIIASGDLAGRREDLWSLQDAAAVEMATRIEPAAQEEALRRVVSAPTARTEAYALYLEGLYAAFGAQGQDYAAGLSRFLAALDLDPGFAPAAAFAPWAAAYGNLIRDRQDLARYVGLARFAARAGDGDARTLAAAATAVFYLDHDFAFGERLVERALDINPNEYVAWICGGWLRVQAGDRDTALIRFARAEALNPLAYGRDGIEAGRALAHFFAGDFDLAEAHVHLALANQPDNPSALSTGVAVAAARNDALTLAERRARFLALYPEGLASMAVQALPFARPELRTRYFDALRAGGVPG